MASLLAIGSLHAQDADNGATTAPSSLSETYEDWSVACAGIGNERRCMLSQRQFHKSGQNILTVELRPSEAGGVQGNVALPFGLYLDKGISFGVDDAKGAKPSRFRTCLPAGCIVQLSFTEPTVKSLRGGKMLKLVAFASDSENEVAFSVSLKGFAAALDRTIALSSKK
ncbi:MULTISPECIES: invasion associated locus B family protein [unclassified Rhizobium]|uniref:invasion associated locus B family protein n=1 Tax=unclassified Rhizobium TaxID=2613769 RepID=UPI0016031A93|nr:MULTISPECIES: invasion associated locus B family protein [unclassified Rhizobium]MBN8952441.1 invasion associated locus B family protein [Rhizobium tropici]